MKTHNSENKPKSAERKKAETDAHRDPLSGRAGAHPVGTGVGAAAGGLAAGAATGAAVGTVAGPVGTAVGAVAGAIAGAVGGGLAGKAIAEGVNPTVEHGYWRHAYASRPYAQKGVGYDTYGPAYQYGWESHAAHAGKSFDQAEPGLERDWESVRGKSKLKWNEVRGAVRDSWDRVSKGGDEENSRA